MTSCLPGIISIDVCRQTIGAKRFADTRYSEVYEVCPVGLECVGREFHGAGGLFIGVSGSSRHSASFAMEMVAVWMGLPKCHATLHRRPLRICRECVDFCAHAGARCRKSSGDIAAPI